MTQSEPASHELPVEADRVIWSLRAPPVLDPDFTGELPDWLNRIKAIRSAVIAALNPEDAGGSAPILDNDPLDSHSYHRSLASATRQIAGLVVLSHKPGLSRIYGIAGTRMGQDRILLRTGAVPVPGVGLVDCLRFNVPVRLMEYDEAHPPRQFSGILDIMAG